MRSYKKNMSRRPTSVYDPILLIDNRYIVEY
jgi:hypothetical protein